MCLLKRQFWWPSLDANTLCAPLIGMCQGQVLPLTPTADLLLIQPIPGRPWFHIALDMVITVVISEAVHFDLETSRNLKQIHQSLLLLCLGIPVLLTHSSS